ncbi:CGNR zinc finger domain-containing protein [Paractinoplanes rishiriensis]|uniref:Zinc finger CGNR domain-containing protein n=1 Tax=Paractinoplanes rishiriensis TaxID=1050105 RepID=A0A919K202_9ACTN|nr:ABATE domain-containing protein [Actinoplanes rishiriensis]GIE99210.1 hypothetical protein Ari01nite_66750 [Actinoplanes rishiriensis]
MEFNFFGGDLALDLTGTLGRRYGGTPVEFLHTPADLHRWFAAAGVGDPSAVVGDADLAAAKELREAIYRLAYAAMTAAVFDPADRAVVNEAAAVAPPLVRIDDTGALVRSGSARASLSLVARAAIALVTGPATAQLHECEGPACTRMFLDNSARGTRRWCDMSRCGNRAKVAKFRARQTT